ncbi:MAG: sodium:solute symporter family transporter, partial [Planctomycetota bacterium]
SWQENVTAAYEIGKLQVFHWGSDPNDDRLFWVLMIFSTVQTMAAMGVDQDLTQRMLTCPDLKRGQRSLILNACIGFPVPCMFLLIGTLIFFLARQSGGEIDFTEVPPDKVFGHFIANVVPPIWGLKGLLVAGVFAAAMSSLDSALGALSSSAVTDFYRPYVRSGASPAHYLFVARLFTLLFGILLAVVALLFTGHRDLLEAAFSYASLVFGGMLGVFLLGVLTRSRGRDVWNVVAMVTSIVMLLIIKGTGADDSPIIAWPWWVVIGALWTFVVGAIPPTPRRTSTAGTS